MTRLLLLFCLLLPAGVWAEDLRAAIRTDFEAHLEPLYRHLHAHPELSFAEVETARRIGGRQRRSDHDHPAAR